MFGLGFGEIAAVVIIAVIVFGPDRLPEFARQAAGFIKTFRKMADNAKSELRKELGDDLKDLGLDEITSLDPRKVVRETLLGDTPSSSAPTHVQSPLPANSYLPDGAKAPFDEEAT